MAVGGKERISKAEALSFLLTHIIVERGVSLELDQLGLFELNGVAQRAVDEINDSEGIIPHEVIERLAGEYLEKSLDKK